VKQADIQATIDALVDRSRLVNGKPTSLADVGYTDAGIDDCWQKCGSYGPKKYTYHDENGNPVVDTTLFPDLKSLTAYGHARNLTVGWYGNNCHVRGWPISL
jgi:alpha-galactosidase